MHFPDVRPLEYFFTSKKEPSPYSNTHDYDLWNESQELFDLPLLDRISQENDQQTVEELTTSMQVFFEKNCKRSRINFSLLGSRPLTFETCKLALWIYKNFNAMFTVNEEMESRIQFGSESFLAHYQIAPLPEIKVTQCSLNALKRYTYELKIKRISFAPISSIQSSDSLLLQEHKLYSTRDIFPRHQTPIPMKEKECFDDCTLF